MTIAGAILAGGAGSRMQPSNVPKPLVELAGKPLLAYVIERLEGQVHPLLINSPLNEGYERFGLPLAPDLRPERLGPLAGMEAVHAHLSTGCPQAGHILFAPADTPFLPKEFVARMTRSPGRVRIARSGGRLHPTASLWPMDALSGLGVYLETPGCRRSVLDYAHLQGFDVEDFRPGEGIDPFFNVNRPDDLHTASAHLTPPLGE
ncbi:molybdenum cofactor guanylyltransferase [Aureimonas altamirensis DSM 21988]|uniref:Molybdenum cofactor guanylyltransferase n=1 Tax=Aureimonas altamirensis DSM 21988 TaxID=1121026 RepID=A0ABY1I650_9HYPH|nr:NTP transferase domain-containing protein [Aureimonas altamirensis]SHI67046.1 molybdenum cofactor guanylyltransferase [Aureimonas altamirensis DSM 21988]